MRVLNIVVVLISFAFGAFTGAWYQISQQTFKSEEIIAKEIALLEQYKNKPGCEFVLDTNMDWGTIPISTGIIVWRYDVVQGSLQKIIVDRTMTSAYEEITLNCLKETSK